MAEDVTVDIALLLRTSVHYGREIARGIGLWSHREPRVRLRLLPFTAGPARAALERLRPAGVIGQVWPVMRSVVAGLDIPVVNVSPPGSAPGFPCVSVHSAAIGRAAAEHLLSCGYRHFAAVSAPRTIEGDQRLSGFTAAIAAAAARQPSPSAVAPVEVWAQELQGRGWDELSRRLQALPRPLGLFAYDDHLVRQLVPLCEAAGLQLPAHVGILVASDDELDCELTQPGLTSVQLPCAEIGRRAAARLWCRLQGGPAEDDPELLLPPAVTERASTRYAPGADDRLSRALAFMRAHLAEALTVADIARHAGVSRRWLERRCRLRLGRSPAQELRRLRLAHARGLLSSSPLSLAEVAAASGYASASRLCVAFRRAFDQTPGQYRRASGGAD